MKLERVEEVAAVLPLGSFYLPTEVELFCTMRDDYVRWCKAEPLANRCMIALKVGARAFNIPIPVLQAPRDQTNLRLVEDRQKLMAFSRVVSIGRQKQPNQWKGIARAFHRQHPCVIHATQKYGAQIAAAMEMSQ